MEDTWCACMGPQYGEPYCYCEMKRRGLQMSKQHDWSPEDIEKLNKALAEIFNWKKDV